MLTSPCAVSVTKASVITSLFTTTRNTLCHNTVFNSRIVIISDCFITCSGTLNICNHSLNFAGILSHNCSNSLSNVSATDRAAINRCVSLCNCFSQTRTARISASTAVITWKCLKYSLLFLIYFNFKYIAKNSQKYTYDKTDTANCCNRNYYSKSVHIICLLSYSYFKPENPKNAIAIRPAVSNTC